MTRLAREIGSSAAWVLLVTFCGCSGCGDRAPEGGGVPRGGGAENAGGRSAPGVVWVFKAREHFIASPVLDGQRLYVSGLGAFNTAVFRCLAIGPDAPGSVLWSKGVPDLKIPIVCAPATSDGLLVFGDGMHQTDGAVLHCLRGETGRLVWQFPLPGRLVHIEGTPAIHGGRVYVGGGDAGVLCVDLGRVTLDGKEVDLAAAEALVGKQWDALMAKYEEEKKKDAQFAVPPNEDALSKPVPRLVWRAGEKVWHVDAPIALSGDRVLVASAYVEEDKVGRRALLCLNAADGKVTWEVPLKVNPWAGATVAGDTVLVACSSIRFDTKQIGSARGEVVAVDVGTGQVRWRKDVAGGVLSRVVVEGGLALFTATDGKVRAWKVGTGEERWSFDAGSAFFGGVAAAGELAYAADLRGVLHAVGLKDGKMRWSLDIAADTAVQSPGMVFGSPVVHEGRVYLGTCNLGGATAEQPCAVVCVSEQRRGGAVPVLPGIHVDRERRAVTIDCRVAPRKLATLQEIYPLEVAATFPAPRGQKAHETVVTFEAKPSDVHRAMESLGLRPGHPARGDELPAAGPEVSISLAVPGLMSGEARTVPLEKTMVDRRTGRSVPPLRWHFTGSVMRQTDPTRADSKAYGADIGGTLITLFPVTDETVFQSNLTMKESQLLKLETNRNVLPDEGTPVKLVIEVRDSDDARAASRKAGGGR